MSKQNIIQRLCSIIASCIGTKKINMSKQDVLRRICDLVTRVQYSKFKKKKCDCICEYSDVKKFQFDPEIIKFIEEAVEEKLAKS